MSMDEEQFQLMASEPCIVGVDPGSTYTGWVVIHVGTGTVLHSSTVRRPEGMKIFTWAMLCVRTTNEAVAKFNITKVGLEGVEEPNIYHNGRKSVLRPLFLINTAIVAGAYASEWERLAPVIVRPSKNGSGDKDSYPTELTGVRPKTLDGIKLPGVRNHERSSFDVATKALKRYEEGYLYDQKPDLLKGEAEADNSEKKPKQVKTAAKKTPAKRKKTAPAKTSTTDLLANVTSVK